MDEHPELEITPLLKRMQVFISHIFLLMDLTGFAGI
jgi:hypothetical protein